MSKYPGRIVSNLAPAGYSVFFDGTGDYLQVADNAVFDLDTGDFTVEAWWYPTTVSSTYQTIAGLWNSPGSNYGWILQVRSTDVLFSIGTGFFTVLGSTTITANRWYHVAATRSGTTIRVFLNGSLLNSGTSAASGTAVANLQIGRNEDGNQQYVNGYLSNVRIIKGTALYTAAFTPPTQLFNITNTSLLTCNSPAIVDQSTNNFTITANGNAAVSTLTPFTAYVPYNPALGASTPGVWTLDEALQAAGTRQWNMYDPSFNLTTLLLHGNGANTAQNNTFLDSSSNNFTITRNGNTTQGSFSPFSLQPGQWGNFFGTKTDYISTPAVSGITTLTGDFTVEAWVYVTDTSITNWGLIDTRQTGGSAASWLINLDSFVAATGYLINFYNGANNRSSLRVLPNAWQHVAVVRSGSTIRFFVNGILDSTTATISGTITGTATSNPIWIGTKDNGLAGYGSNGYISNFRMVNGTAVYTTTFTPSVEPLTAVSNTVLLTCQSNRFIDANTQVTAKVMTPAGTVSIQPFSPFYPTAAYTPATVGGSGYFDGTGDYLSVASNAAFDQTGNFTAQCWVYLTATPSNFVALFGEETTNYLKFTIDTSRRISINQAGLGVRITGATAIPLNTWAHVAFVKNGTALTAFYNGVSDGTGTISGSNGVASANTINIGREPFLATVLTGYIANLRTSKNAETIALPNAPLTAISGTQLLINFTNAGIVDSTAKNVLETVGNAQISTTQSKFGGSSMYFDGSGDYLQVGPNQLLNIGSSDFTIEFWIYPTSFASATYPMYSTTARATSAVLAFEVNTSGTILVYITASGGATWSIVNAGNIGTLTLNAWNHVALVRNGSSFRGYVNGVQGAMTTTSTSAVASFDGFSIGAYVAAGFLTGYMDDIRITRFARYTAAFTPQTSQWQDQ